jgi:hypothetical protein
MAKSPKTRELKYADKSPGQPQLVPIFGDIRKILATFVKGNYYVKTDKPGQYELYYGKEIELPGSKGPELCFASLLIQKGYVGFYFFPVYMNDPLKKELGAALLRTLKGKTCFHIKKGDPKILLEIKEALQKGYAYYTSNGWKS